MKDGKPPIPRTEVISLELLTNYRHRNKSSIVAGRRIGIVDIIKIAFQQISFIVLINV